MKFISDLMSKTDQIYLALAEKGVAGELTYEDLADAEMEMDRIRALSI